MHKLENIPAGVFYIGTMLFCSLLIAAPTLYIYNTLRPASPASIRASYSVLATDLVAPLQTKGSNHGLNTAHGPLLHHDTDTSGRNTTPRRKPLHVNLRRLDPVRDIILTHPLLALYCGLAVGVIYLLIIAIDFKLSCWRGYDNKF